MQSEIVATSIAEHINVSLGQHHVEHEHLQHQNHHHKLKWTNEMRVP